jgi:histidinol-phosphate aminotransferase
MTRGTVGRTGYRDISLYSPDRAPCRVDLSDNTNGWGMPPAAADAFSTAASAASTRYPSLYAAALKDALASYVGVSADMVTTGCGSDDVLDSSIRAFAEPGDRIAYPDPTFPMIPIFARMNGLVPVPVPLMSSYDVDVDGMRAANARVIYLCSPNNPTGAALSRRSIEAIVGAARGDQFVIIDEAYAEFAGVTVIDLIQRCDRLLVTRTMSKAFGLAGLRVGYAIGAPSLVAEVEKSRGPYKVNAMAERAAIAALGDGLAWVREHIELTIANRRRLIVELAMRRIRPIESDANFVFFPIARALGLARAMRERGVAVRPFEGLPLVSEGLSASNGAALRISIGPWEQLAEALDAFDEVRAQCE